MVYQLIQVNAFKISTTFSERSIVLKKEFLLLNPNPQHVMRDNNGIDRHNRPWQAMGYSVFSFDVRKNIGQNYGSQQFESTVDRRAI